MTTLVSDYTVTRGWSKDIYREIKDEIKQVFMTPIKNEQFVTDRFITFCRKQEMKNALIKSVGILEEDANYDQILKMIDQAMSVGCDGSDSLTYKDLLNLPELFRQKYNPTKLVKTGYPTYDKCFMGGLAAGEIHVIQAPPKSGKSTLACNIGTNALLYNKTVYHISLEIKSVDVMAKYAVRMTNLTYDELVSCSDVEYIERIAKFNQYKPRLFVNYWTELTVSAQVIRGWVSRTRSQTGFNPDLIIVDYDDCLLPVRGSRDDMYNDAGEVYSDLIGLADYFKCPVVTFAQPRREAWEKVNNDELIHSYDLAHSARKAHKTYSISSLNFKEGSNEGIFYIDLARRGESGVKIPIVRDLSRGIIRERANIHAVGG